MDSRKLTRVLRGLLSGDFDFEAPSRRTSTGLALFLAGMGAGVVLGMLFAPARGEQLRSEVSERARQGYQKARSRAQEFAAHHKNTESVPAEKSAS